MPADPQATLDEIKQALANHPRVCNVHAGERPRQLRLESSRF